MDTTVELPHGAFDNIVIIGFGMIGASIAAALKENLPQVNVFGVDTSSSTCETAVSKGWANQAVEPDDPAFEDFVRTKADLVIIATPVPLVPSYFQMLADWDYQGVITDTASTKTHISEAADQILRYPKRYLPGHPMSGSEVNGIAGARSDLFKGAHWILCPNAETEPEVFTRLHELIVALSARVVSLRREDHDAAVAIVSHVPHFVASSLMQLAMRHADDQKSLMRLAAGGFKDSTRIAAGSPELWTGIAFDNAEALSNGLQEMRDILGRFADALSTNDRGTITGMLSDSARARQALPAAWVPSTERLLEVRIPMLDRKGVLAEVTTIASNAGCNIQSIDIDHINEGSAVLSLILTDEGDVGKLSINLIQAGFQVSFRPLVG